MGHIGLTPQSATMLGGFKAQVVSAEGACSTRGARALEAAGCFSLVLEAVPAQVARRISEELAIPTIGIGAGVRCDGQVLVWHDLLGLYEGGGPVREALRRTSATSFRALEACRRRAGAPIPGGGTPTRCRTKSSRSSNRQPSER